MAAVLTRPRLIVECAFASSPFLDLADPELVWTDISAYVELGSGISIGRRRTNELDEPSPGTLSLTLDNSDGRFTRLSLSSPYFPNVKHNRLIRVRALWPDSVNVLSINSATGGGDLASTAGLSVPSGTLSALLGSATATATGTTTTFKCTDADATDIEVGDVVRLWTAAGALKESTHFRVTGESSSGGITTFTFAGGIAGVAAVATAIGDVMKAYRTQWVTGLQPTAGTRLSVGSAGTTTAGPDAIGVTTGLQYTLSVWAARTAATAVSVSPRILWYDVNGVALSETTGSTTALTTALQRLSVTGTAPASAALARVALANETVLAGTPTIAYRAGATNKVQSHNKITVTVPSTVQSGDGLLLWVSCADTNAVTTPTGWTAVANVVHGPSGLQGKTWLYKTVATSSGSTTSAGKTFTITTTGGYDRRVVILEAWLGTDPAGCVHQSNSALETVGTPSLTHVTPNVTTSVANTWIVSACFDMSSGTSSWTAPDTKRHEVFTTGSLSETGAVADNNTPVAIGTYGTKTFTSNYASDNASMWTVALKPSPTSGGSTATVQVTGWQFEQAGSVSNWAQPAASYTRFIGHVDQWPTMWEGGVRALTTVTATDRSKLLGDRFVRAAITEEVLAGAPLVYYPLGEDSGATTAGNIGPTSQPSLPIVSTGAVTDDMLQFGAGTGPGSDAQPALVLAPSTTLIGKALRGALTSPLGGDGVVGMTVAGCFLSSSTMSGFWNIGGVDDGKVTDGGSTAVFDIFGTNTPYLQGHLKMSGLGTDLTPQSNVNYRDGHTHMAVLTATLSGGTATAKLYVDGVLKDTKTGSTSRTEFPEYNRWNVGCAAYDTTLQFFSGTLSHQIGWNRALSASEITDLWDAASDGFAGDLPGARAQRIADWTGLTSMSFEAGAETLGPHPADQTSLLDAFKLIALSEGGLFFVSAGGYWTLHGRAHRTNATSLFTVTADQVGRQITWVEDPTLIVNDVTVLWGANSVRSTDAPTQADYGVQTAEIATILGSDDQAQDRADAYLARYREPVSRPSEVSFDALTIPTLFTSLLGSEIGQKFSVTGLPTGAPATAADLFIEGIGEEISHDAWTFTVDCSPAGFDFGAIFDHATRGIFDSAETVFGW